jgi:hypothetical protein
VTVTHTTVRLPVDSLRAHPRNYRDHPDAQLTHLTRSLDLHGVYRNVVVARDGTILAGHGVVLAARRLGLTELPVVRLDVDPEDPAALQVLTGDNELARLASDDTAVLQELLAELADGDLDALVGTGYSEEDLAALTRLVGYASLGKVDPDAEWVDMPEFSADNLPPGAYRATFRFETMEDADAFVAMIGRPKRSVVFWPEDWDPDQRQFSGEGKPVVVSDREEANEAIADLVKLPGLRGG